MNGPSDDFNKLKEEQAPDDRQLDRQLAMKEARRLSGSQRDSTGLPPIESALAQLEAEGRMLRQEAARLQEENKMLERMMKTKESALMEAVKKMQVFELKAMAVDDLQNKNQELCKEMAAKEEEIKVLDKLHRTKVAEVEKLSTQVVHLQEAVTAGGATQNALLEQERQIQELQDMKRTLERELGRAKATAQKVATAVANEWKDDSDKVIPVKQWLEERRFMQGELQALRDKLAHAERSTKSESQLKDRLQARLKVLEDGLKSGNINGNAIARRLSMNGAATGGGKLSPARTDSQEAPPAAAASEESPKGEDVVSGVLYDTLQKEVLSVRKSIAEKDQILRDKEDAIEMLTRKVETISKALESDSKRSKRVVASLEKEMSALKVELANKEQENRVRRTSTPSAKQTTPRSSIFGVSATTPRQSGTSAKSPRSPVTPPLSGVGISSPHGALSPQVQPKAATSRIPTPAAGFKSSSGLSHANTFGASPRTNPSTPSRIPTPSSVRRGS